MNRIVLLAGWLLFLSSCDADITGEAFENQAPDTQLSVRDASLVDNLDEADRLTSTVDVSWTGSDPDGYVDQFEVRFYDDSATPGPEEGWSMTVSNDSLVLLPIPRGDRVANVVFEVRSVDNEGLRDPDPARTVFPIQNAPPRIRFSSFDLPPDTTFHVFSIAVEASDPEGEANLSRIEVSFNDSLNFTALPIDAAFMTFVGQVERGVAPPAETNADVFLGRGFQRTEFSVPGLRLNAPNTLYVRAVDQTDTTSTRQAFEWFVKAPTGPVLYVNDYRKSSFNTVQQFHLDLLRDYLPGGTGIDIWDISQPFAAGSAGNVPRSDALPPNADPTLRQMFAAWDYIYWVSTNTVNAIGGINLPFAAPALDVFFEQGGKMMVHSPVTQPQNPEDNLGNPAILLLPLSDLLVRPDTLQRLELPRDAAVNPLNSLPGVSEPLPALKSQFFFINELPFFAEGNNIIPLYEAEYQYLTRSRARGAWTEVRTMAALSADQRIGLFSLPLLNETNGQPILIGADDDPNAGRRATRMILESLGFPKG